MGKNDIGNPESMSPKEEKEFDELKKNFDSFFDELKDNDAIKISSNPESGKYLDVMKTVDRHSKIYNILMEIVKSEKLSDEFLVATGKFGFNTNNIAEMILFHMIQLYNNQTEMLKNGFIFVLNLPNKTQKAPLGGLLRYIEDKKLAPNTFSGIQELLDIKLRNSLSHCFYWIEGNKFIVAENSKFENPKEITIGEFMMKGKKINMISQAYIKVLGNKAKTGFFKDS